ncbi:uncharacterized protein VTP21DRAFT_7527 [Calcarisporiella thermophila]|uniref:uncharacterized protein n=1 Tax=Calcarisporiella thermophila TaxID=911321 RepID=UPI003744433B
MYCKYLYNSLVQCSLSQSSLKRFFIVYSLSFDIRLRSFALSLVSFGYSSPMYAFHYLPSNTLISVNRLPNTQHFVAGPKPTNKGPFHVNVNVKRKKSYLYSYGLV